MLIKKKRSLRSIIKKCYCRQYFESGSEQHCVPSPIMAARRAASTTYGTFSLYAPSTSLSLQRTLAVTKLGLKHSSNLSNAFAMRMRKKSTTPTSKAPQRSADARRRAGHIFCSSRASCSTGGTIGFSLQCPRSQRYGDAWLSHHAGVRPHRPADTDTVELHGSGFV